MSMIVAGALIAFWVLCVIALWCSWGCSGRYIRHAEYEEYYDGKVSQKTPQYDSDTEEAYAKTFKVYRKKCSRCGRHNIFGRRLEEVKETRWESDKTKEMM